VREDAETDLDLVDDGLAEPGGRDRLLEGQEPAEDRTGARAAVGDLQGPDAAAAVIVEGAEGQLRIEPARERRSAALDRRRCCVVEDRVGKVRASAAVADVREQLDGRRSEEHTSELQSRVDLV